MPRLLETLDGVPRDIQRLQFRRTRNAHRGIADLQGLTHLWAHQANQDMIGEIARLPNLELLYIRGTTASDLAPLAANRKLKRLIVVGGTKVANLDWTNALTAGLEVLFLEGFSRITDITPLGNLSNLASLGVEGGMDSTVRIETLQPLAALKKLRYLFLAGTRVADKSLAPLARMDALRHLEVTIHYPDHEFIALKKALPDLDCGWIRMIDEHGSLRAAKAAILAGIRRGPQAAT